MPYLISEPLLHLGICGAEHLLQLGQVRRLAQVPLEQALRRRVVTLFCCRRGGGCSGCGLELHALGRAEAEHDVVEALLLLRLVIRLIVAQLQEARRRTR